MAINFALKYSNELAKKFSHASYIKNHCKAKIDFTGVKTVRVYMLNTTKPVDYIRSGSNRYGELKDVQDTVLEYTMTQDKAFNGVVDKGDESEQTINNKAGQWLKEELKQEIVPEADKYAFKRLAAFGHVAGVAAEPKKDTIVKMIYDAAVYMDEHQVPENGRILFVRAKDIPNIIMSTEWSGLDSLAGKQLPKGVCGQIAGFTVVKVPTRFLPDNCFFIAMIEGAAAYPTKINDTKVHTDPVGISGAVVEGRQLYDVFVLGNKADGVYAAVLSTAKLATPTITDTTKTAVTLTSSGASKIYYTLDGSDPRFSMTRDVYTAAFDGSGKTVKACAMDTDGKFSSDIAEKTVEA